MPLFITDNKKYFILTTQLCIKLELELNVSGHGREWSHIGDKLYYSVHPRNNEDSESTFVINSQQFNFLGSLISGWGSSYSSMIKEVSTA